MTFEQALSEIKRGHRLQRMGWNGPGQYVSLSTSNVPAMLPYLYIVTVQDDRVPWLASQTDLLADDWEIYER